MHYVATPSQFWLTIIVVETQTRTHYFTCLSKYRETMILLLCYPEIQPQTFLISDLGRVCTRYDTMALKIMLTLSERCIPIYNSVTVGIKSGIKTVVYHIIHICQEVCWSRAGNNLITEMICGGSALCGKFRFAS